MYDCKAPLSRFYYPETRRIINAFIIIIIIIYKLFVHPLAGYVYISNQICSAKFVTRLTSIFFETKMKTEPQDTTSDIYYASLSKIVRDPTLIWR